MGNSRRSIHAIKHRQKVLTRNDLIRRIGYLEGQVAYLQSELEKVHMERPADLDEWIASVLPDLSDEERVEWEAMSEEDRAEFVDQLGQRIAAAERLLPPEPAPTGSEA